MPDESHNESTPNPRREWTLMFYFASDNPLAPGIVSQLKALKNAGYHQEVNVIAQFDPHSKGVPVHVFEVNGFNKLVAPDAFRIGSGLAPFVRNLVLDKLWGDSEEEDKIKTAIRGNAPFRMGARARPRNTAAMIKKIHAASFAGRNELQDPESEWGDRQRRDEYNPPAPPQEMSGELSPEDSLTTFLDFCREKYPARHYVLFILGHGVVVGNDLFLYDEDAREHSLTLKKLGGVLGNFTRKLPPEEKFELISFHSCSMSSLEVAYELRGTAKYMIASQSLAFVGSWPYAPIIMRIMKDIALEQKVNDKKVTTKEKRSRDKKIREQFEKIFDYCVHNSYDFLLAGYSFNLTLCNLTKTAMVTKPLANFSALLTDSLLNDKRAEQQILLAHWEAQSFWHESYTDLYDFCAVLQRNCRNAVSPSSAMVALGEECELVKGTLEKASKEDSDTLVIRSECVGPVGQYSNGFSVYFPWSAPSPGEFWSKEYPEYVFEETGWRKFLNAYFEKTRRDTAHGEAKANGHPVQVAEGSTKHLLDTMGVQVFNEEGQLGKGSPTDATGNTPPSKGAPTDPTGIGCDCPSIKNYPSFTIDRGEEGEPEDDEGKKGAKKVAKKRKARPKKGTRKAKAARAAKKGSG